MTMFSKAHCIGTPSCNWSEKTLTQRKLTLLSLLIEPLTGYARILSHSEDKDEINRCIKRGFLIAETLPYKDDLDRLECRMALSQTLKVRRANLEWINAVEELPCSSTSDFILIPRTDSDENSHTVKSELKKTVTIAHRYLCATLDGD